MQFSSFYFTKTVQLESKLTQNKAAIVLRHEISSLSLKPFLIIHRYENCKASLSYELKQQT